MTTDLWYLACTAMLTAALWIPYIVCQVMTNGALAPAKTTGIRRRARFPCGASALTAPISTRSNVSLHSPRSCLSLKSPERANGMTAFWAMSFFWLRLAHAIVYWAAVPYLRTVLFTLGFICVAGIFWEVVKSV